MTGTAARRSHTHLIPSHPQFYYTVYSAAKKLKWSLSSEFWRSLKNPRTFNSSSLEAIIKKRHPWNVVPEVNTGSRESCRYNHDELSPSYDKLARQLWNHQLLVTIFEPSGRRPDATRSSVVRSTALRPDITVSLISIKREVGGISSQFTHNSASSHYHSCTSDSSSRTTATDH